MKLQYVPSPKYADTICAFRTECSKYLNTSDEYISTGWTFWQISNGKIEYSVGDSLRRGHAHHSLFLSPRDKIKIHSFSKDLNVSVICVPELLMNIIMRTKTSKQKLFTLPLILKQNDSFEMHHAELNDKARTELHHIFSILIDRVPPAASLASIELAIPLVESMVLLIFEAVGVSLNAIRPESRMEKIATDFMVSLPGNYVEHQDVEYYAERSCVSAKYLTSVIKNMTSASPTEWINRMLTTRAQELLWLTDKTVNEISEELHFSSTAVFIRFFKRRVGTTPKQYKEMQKQKHEV